MDGLSFHAILTIKDLQKIPNVARQIVASFVRHRHKLGKPVGQICWGFYNHQQKSQTVHRVELKGSPHNLPQHVLVTPWYWKPWVFWKLHQAIQSIAPEISWQEIGGTLHFQDTLEAPRGQWPGVLKA
jgi:hypothetical protein